MRLATLSLIYVLFGIYGWLCIVNVGIAMLKLLPRSTFTRQGQRLFAPAWEITQLFLLCGVVALLFCFRNGAGSYVRPIAPILIIAACLLLLRIGLVVALFEARARSGLTIKNLLFLLITVALPCSIGAAGIQLLEGSAFWQSVSGWTLLFTLVAGLLAGGLAFVYFVVGRTPHDRLHQVSRLLNIVVAALIGVGLQLAVRPHVPQLHALPYEIFIVLGVFIAVLQLGLWLSARERYMWWHLSLLAALTPLLWGLAARPYIAFPHSLSTKAYSVADHSRWAVVALSITLAILIGGTIAIANWLLRFRQHTGR